MAAPKLHFLCSVCAKLHFGPKTLVKGNRLGRTLYGSLQLVESSAKSECHLCMLIFTSLAPQNGTDDSWKREYDGPVKCGFKYEDGEPYFYVTWNFVTRKFSFSCLPSPRVLRQVSIPTTLRTSSLLQHAEIEISPKSPLIFSQISKWLNSCIKSHLVCHLDSPSMLPSRVIDVGTSEELCDPHILITNGQSGKYAALSYRWGISPTLTKTSQNLASHIRGMKMELLPKTIQDAILVSRALGLRYLWVDALCIIQDSPQDWVEQAGKMAEIYQDAHLTISADSAEGSNSGFLADRDSRAIRSCHHTRARLSIHPEIPPVFDNINFGSLSNRGWILQERIFSRRIIHWSHLEVGWECREMQASERDPQGQANVDWLGSNARNMLVSRDSVNLRLNGVSDLPGEPIPPDGTFQKIRSDVYNAWYRLIQEYSKRLLTYPDKDKLIALSSISKTYHKRCSRILGPEESYICGLWKGDLARGLAFSYGTGTMERKRLGMLEVVYCNVEDPSTWNYRPPSFSWARGDGGATWGEWLETSHDLSEHDVEVLEIHNTTTTANIWGPVENCWIKLRGVVCSREMLCGVPSYNYQLDDDVESYDLLQRERYLRLNVALKPDGAHQQTWLMIHPVGETDEYRRIGIVSLVGDFASDWTDKTNIKLV